MCSSWENVILSWVNLCSVCSDHINKLDDLSDENLLRCFVPSCMKDDHDNQHQKTIKFINRQYPGVWTQIPSELRNEDALIIYSLLIHYYSFIDDPLMRNKMCSLSNTSQVQIRRFLEFLLNKDITKDTVQLAIKSCCESPVQSLIKFFDTKSNESKTPLRDFLQLSNKSSYTLPKISQELDEEETGKERVILLRSELSNQSGKNESFEETSLESARKVSTYVRRRTSYERESFSSASFADNKVDKDTSLEWDYTDVFDDLCPTEVRDSPTADTLHEDSIQNTTVTLQKDITTLDRYLILERSLRKGIKEKDLKLREVECKMARMENEVATLTDVQKKSRDNFEMSKKVKLLQEEFNTVSECFRRKSELLEEKERIIESYKIKNHETIEKELFFKKEIALKETILVEKIREISKLTKELETQHQDSIEKQNIILNLREENKLLQKTLAENAALKNNIAAKNESLRGNEIQIEKYIESIYSLKMDLQDRSNKIVVLFEKALALKEELTQLKITTVHELTSIKSFSENVKRENDILRNEKLLLEKKLIENEELVEELRSQIFSLKEDLIKNKKEADNRMNKHVEENISLETKISDEQFRAAEILKKYTNLKIKYVEKATECAKKKAFYEEQLSNWKEQVQAAFNEEKERIVKHSNSTTLDLQKSLELRQKNITMCHEDALNLRQQVRELHEQLFKVKDEKAKLEMKLSSLNRNRDVCAEIGERPAFFYEQRSVERHYSRVRRLADAPTIDGNPQLLKCGETEISMRREKIHSRTVAFPPQTGGNEEFNGRHLEDMKAGRCSVDTSEENLLTEYQRRNSLVRPHLKSSYTALDSADLLNVTEDETKFGLGGVQERRHK